MAPPADSPDEDMTADDHDAAALRDRVADLEQTVAEQQATIESLQQPPASRRGVLAALTGVAGAGALGAYSQRASAQAAGQVGTQSEPVDVFANTIDSNEVIAADVLADSVSAEQVSITDRILQSDDFLDISSLGVIEGPSDVSTSSYTRVADGDGLFSTVDIPPGASLYGRFFARMVNDTSGETVTAAPNVFNISDNTTDRLTALEVSVTGTSPTTVDSGWTQITSLPTGIHLFEQIDAKVSNGTGSFSGNRVAFVVGWRID